MTGNHGTGVRIAEAVFEIQVGVKSAGQQADSKPHILAPLIAKGSMRVDCIGKAVNGHSPVREPGTWAPCLFAARLEVEDVPLGIGIGLKATPGERVDGAGMHAAPVGG